MSNERSCPTCGGGLPPDAPEGACPKCLLAAGFESADGAAAGGTLDLSEVAEEFPELEILEELGRGGMGVVYKARQKRLDRFVALKVLPREIAESAPDAARFEDRFTREARALARLSHPNIVGVHEFGERHGMYFFLMEYVDGANLRQTMRAGKLSPAEALTIVPQICDALQYAHDRGVVHRDIKPENVLLDVDGNVKIADFGLAKLVTRAADDRTLTRQGLVMGTPHYMAPEQLEKPSEVDHRADIYSLGVVLYEMLTGELPIGRFAAPSEKVQVDVKLDQVVLRSLEKEADRRYQAVSEVKTGIGGVDLSAPVAAAVAAPRDGLPVRPNSRSSKLAFWGLLLPLVAMVLGGVLSVGMFFLRSGGTNQSWAAMPTVLLMGGLVGVAVLLGMVFSIAGIVQIKRSDGRLRGMGMAIAGLLLPLLCCLPGVALPLMWMTRVAAPAPMPAIVADVSEPIFGDPYPPAFLSGVDFEDLGEFRVEIELGAGEAAFGEKRLGILGLGAEPLDAGMSTSSTPTWPPEPGTLVHVRGLQRIAPAGDSAAHLLFADELISAFPERSGSTQKTDLYVSAERAAEIEVAFDGAEHHVVAVYGRVVRPHGRSVDVPPPAEQRTVGGVSIRAHVGARTGAAADHVVTLTGPRSRAASVAVNGDAAHCWPLETGYTLVIERIALSRASFDGTVCLKVGDEEFELVNQQTGRAFQDLSLDVMDVEDELQLEITGGDAVTVDITGSIVRPAGAPVVTPPVSVVANAATLTLEIADGAARRFHLLDATDAGAVVTVQGHGSVWPLPAGHELRVRKVRLEGGVAVTVGDVRLPPQGVEFSEFESHLSGETIRAGHEDEVVLDVSAQAAKVVLEGQIVKLPAPTRSLRFVINVPEGDREELPAKVHPLRILAGGHEMADLGPALIELHGDLIQLPLPTGWEFRPRRVELTGRGAVQVGRRRHPAQGFTNGSFSRAYGGQSFGADRVDDVVIEVLEDEAYVELHGELVLPPEADDAR